VIILPNVTIGNNCVIGAGSIVTKDVPSDTVFAGVPAKYIKSYSEYISDSLRKGFPTKRMVIMEKKKYLEKNRQEWFHE
jgi:serine acetyltransferase